MIILSEINKSLKKLSDCDYNDKKDFFYNILTKYNNFIFSYKIQSNSYIQYKKFKNYYIIYVYYKYKLSRKDYVRDHKSHREDGPACIMYDDNGEIHELYYLNGDYYSYENYLLEIKKLIHIC